MRMKMRMMKTKTMTTTTMTTTMTMTTQTAKKRTFLKVLLFADPKRLVVSRMPFFWQTTVQCIPQLKASQTCCSKRQLPTRCTFCTSMDQVLSRNEFK